jgi:arylsulfatase
MLGTRGVWYKGWHACTVHAPTPSDWSNFELDTWELYCMDGDEWKGKLGRTHRVKADPTQSRNLATVYPRKLERLKNMWFVQAGIYNGVPLDDRSTTEILSTPRPQLADPPDFSGEGDWPEDEFGYIYYPGGSEIPEAVAPNIRTRSYSITATVDFSSGDTPEGVLLAHGGRFGGHSFYIHENRLCYVYNWLGQREQKVSCSLPNNLSGEVVKLKVEFAKTGMLQNDPKFGSSTVGNVSLFISDMDTPVTPIEHNLDSFEDTQKGKFLTQPSKFALSGEGFNIGRDAGQPVSHDYATHIPYEFEGAILKNVVVAIKNDAAAADHDKEFRGMLWRD